MPVQDADITLLERFLDYLSSMFWIVVMLELPIVAKLELLCRFLDVLIKNLDVTLLSHDFLDPDRVLCVPQRESFSYQDVCMIPLHDACIRYMICIWGKKGEAYDPTNTASTIKHGG